MDDRQVCDCKIQKIFGKRAKVWKYFGILTDTGGKSLDSQHYYCEVCYNDYKESTDKKIDVIKRFRTSTGTSNFTNHLFDAHGIIPKNDSPIKPFLTIRPPQSQASYKAKKKQLTDDLTVWFCRDLLPFGKIDSPGLQDFLLKYQIVRSKSAIPCSRNLAINGIKRIYSSLETKVRSILPKKNFALAVDMWTDSCRRMKYIGVVLHYIKDTKLMTVNLGTIAFPESHTSLNIYAKITDVCSKFDLDISKAYIVRDNGANIVAACRSSGVSSHGCIGHGIHNLITVDGLKNVPTLVTIFDKMKEIHSHLRYKAPNLKEYNCQSLRTPLNSSSSPTANPIEEIEDSDNEETDELLLYDFDFTDIAEEVVIPNDEPLNDLDNGNRGQPTTLKAYCPTRWHSFLIMAQSILTNSNAINSLLITGDDTNLILSRKDLNIIKKLVNYLQIFKDTVDILSCGSNPTINKALLLRCELESKLDVEEDDSLEIVQLKSNMKLKLEKRFPVTDLLIVASILDPKFKDLHAIHKYCDDHFTTRKDLIKQFYRDLIGNYCDDEENQNETAGVLTQLARKHSARPERESTFDLEIDSYLLSKDERDVLVFWSDRQAAWPKLFELSKAVLSIPATSVPVERLFSIAGLTLTKKRCQLNPKRVDKILFIHDNYDLFTQ